MEVESSTAPKELDGPEVSEGGPIVVDGGTKIVDGGSNADSASVSGGGGDVIGGVGNGESWNEDVEGPAPRLEPTLGAKE